MLLKICRVWIVILALGYFLSHSVEAKSWNALTANSEKRAGFFNLYVNKSEAKVFLEIEHFEKPFIYYTGLPYGVGSNDIGLDRGQLGESRLVQFERYGNKVLLKQLNIRYRADTENVAEKLSVKQAFASSVLAGFEIKSKQGNKVLIELTPYLLQDLHGIANRIKMTKQGNYSVDSKRSAVITKKVKSFPKNVVFESLLTLKGTKAGKYVRQVTPDTSAISVQQHLSFVELPDSAYKPRVFHPRAGYFPLTYKDYATPITEPMDKKLIYRHRLSRRKNGAFNPIVYYLDPGVPEPVKGALLDGARWWEQAFEKAGLKGAYKVEVLPEDVDPMDVRYNVIQWVHRATRGWSYGGSVSDPRTGEILKGHVTLGSLRVRQDLLIANALTGLHSDPTSKKQKAATEMALARIRQLSAHEVGHTLGIAHNFASSPLARASVMDYPHPLIKLKNNKISLDDAYAVGIGSWDIETIRYGYSEFKPEEEASGLAKILKGMTQKGFVFISDSDARPVSGAHPSAHLWDNGAQPAQELERVLTIRAKALNEFDASRLPEGMPYSELAETLVPLYLFHRYQVEAAVKLIGGVEYEYSVKGDDFKPVKSVPAESQTSALTAILSTLSEDNLKVPSNILALIPPKAYGYSRNRESFPSKTGLTLDPVSMAETSAQHSLRLLLNAQRLARVLQQEMLDDKQLSFANLINQVLQATVKSNARQGVDALLQQRVDYLTVAQMIRAADSASSSPEVKARLYAELSKLNAWLVTQANRNPDRYLWLKKVLDNYFSGELKIESLPVVTMPPGSPIGSH